MNAEKFRQYRLKHNISKRKFASLLEVSESLMGFYERGLRKPSFKIACKITEITNGEITLEDLGFVKKVTYVKKSLDP